MTKIIAILCLFGGMALYAQTPISAADTKKLGYKKVVRFLKRLDLRYFCDIQPSVNDGSDLSAFYFHNSVYTVNASVERVWETCLFASPENLWKGKTLGLSCIYSKNSDKIFYRSQSRFDTLELNQVYFINIRIMPLFSIASALIVTKIDYDEKLIEFTYIEGNKSNGRQTVRLIANSDNETGIIHDTYYKSSSKFRDKRLYPLIHKKVINDLHKNIDKYSQKIKNEPTIIKN